MGIQRKKFYVVKCDICGTHIENGEGGILCIEKETEINGYIEGADWTKKNGKIACESCYEEL